MYKMNMLGGSVGFLESQFQKRLVQVCLFAAILFWILGSYNLIDQVQKLLSKVGLRFGKDSTRVVHALIFAVLLYLLTRFIMDPVVRRAKGSVVEGQQNAGATDPPATDPPATQGQANSPDSTCNFVNLTDISTVAKYGPGCRQLQGLSGADRTKMEQTLGQLLGDNMGGGREAAVANCNNVDAIMRMCPRLTIGDASIVNEMRDRVNGTGQWGTEKWANCCGGRGKDFHKWTCGNNLGPRPFTRSGSIEDALEIVNQCNDGGSFQRP